MVFAYKDLIILIINTSVKSQTPSNKGSENHWWIHQSRGCEKYVREVILLFSPYFCLYNRHIGVYPAPDGTEIEGPVSESPLQDYRNIIRTCSNSLQRRIRMCSTTFVLYKSAHSVETFAWRLTTSTYKLMYVPQLNFTPALQKPVGFRVKASRVKL